jgi:hypothetical protein
MLVIEPLPLLLLPLLLLLLPGVPAVPFLGSVPFTYWADQGTLLFTMMAAMGFAELRRLQVRMMISTGMQRYNSMACCLCIHCDEKFSLIWSQVHLMPRAACKRPFVDAVTAGCLLPTYLIISSAPSASPFSPAGLPLPWLHGQAVLPGT